ncbi:class II glutamine amidotransferase [Floccifex sp.]|uniref:class II glutamine amidotransferase n=1 Tax=Floccifex sp. TaxID=2815810 RepID=UPI003F0A52C6
MCELFGVSSLKQIQVNSFLQEFFSHGVNHPNGWGLAIFHYDFVNLEKEPIPSFQSIYLKERLKSEIVVKNMMAHIRLATRGIESYDNTHPFVLKDHWNRTWTLEHNGTIFESGLLDSFLSSQKGQSDSEKILYYIIDQINQKGYQSKENRFQILDQIICSLAPNNKLNILLYDGQILYVHTNYKNSLFFLKKENSIIFSTTPLDNQNWQLVDFCQLLAFQDGKLLFKGKKHSFEYIDNEKDMKYLFLDHSYL